MADGIAYPAPVAGRTQTNPLQQMEQLQALGLRGAEMQRVQQTVQQQELVNQSKRAIGALAQQSLDPATGELDMHKLLGMAAQHPEAALGYTELLWQAIDMDLINKQRHEKDLDIQAKELDFASKTMSGLADDPDVQNNTPAAKGKILGAFAQMGMATGKPRDWATQRALEYSQLQDQYKVKPSQFVKNALTSSTQGLAALTTARKNFKDMTAPVNITEYDPNTGEYVPTTIPRSEWLKRQAGRGNLVGVGSAPPGAASRLEGSPSVPPAVPYGERSVATGMPAGEAERIKGQSEAWNTLRHDVQEGAQNATASMMQIQDMEGKLKSMGYRTGMFAPEQLQLAKAALFFDPQDQSGALNMVLGAKNPQEAAKIIGTMEAFDKQAIIQKTEALRTAMGSANKLTNAEFKTFQDALVGLRSSPQGIAEIYKYMEKLNRLVQHRADFLDKYTELLGHTPHKNDTVRFEKEWFKHVQENPGLYSYDGPKAEGEK
jgi:hypothetical protein